MQAYLIPLGFRCNAAMVTNAIVNQPRFVFDWTQMNIQSMIKVLELQPSEIRVFWIQYFAHLNKDKRHTETNSWFPHDTFITEDDMSETVEKYIRRTKRLHQLFNIDAHIIFLIFHGYPQADSLEKSKEIMSAMVEKKSTNVSFILCNASYLNEENANVYLLHELFVSTDDEVTDWDDLTKRVTSRVKLFLEEKHIEITPFLADAL